MYGILSSELTFILLLIILPSWLAFILLLFPSPFLQIAKENARPLIPKFVNHHLQRIIDICWNADPNKRPRFEKIQPILDKLEV